MTTFALQTNSFSRSETNSGQSAGAIERITSAFSPIFFRDSMTTTSGVFISDYIRDVANSTGPGVILPFAEANGISAVEEVKKLRMISGLTWDHLAELFNVSKRSLHFWACGRAISASNLEKLNRILATIERVDTGYRSENRKLILSQIGGTMPFDLLRSGSYDEFVKLLGYQQRNTTNVERNSLSESESKLRKPSSPDMFLNALQDKVHKDVGEKRAVKVKRA